MIRVEFTIGRRHLFVLVGILAVGVLAVPTVSWAASQFDDVPDSNVFVADIEWLADAGITKGCNPPANTEFCPSSYVTRGQMAAVMHRLAGGDDRTVDGRLDALEDLLAGGSRTGDTLLFDGMNLQVVNGMGKTDSKNTLGNVIIGYNERYSPLVRTGSHYLVIGPQHAYTEYSGIVAGIGNTVSGDYASVLGGIGSIASGARATVLGGAHNTASGSWSTVSGGTSNTASLDYSSVSGGEGNHASGSHASVAGGVGNAATGNGSTVSGGSGNIASGLESSVSGGLGNEAKAHATSILGGNTRGVSGDYGTYPFCGC